MLDRHFFLLSKDKNTLVTTHYLTLSPTLLCLTHDTLSATHSHSKARKEKKPQMPSQFTNHNLLLNP